VSADTRATYARIADELRKAILSGRMAPGDAIPTEHELADRYGTSRVTVRKALNVLKGEQLTVSRQGKGYFVKKPDYSRYVMTFAMFKPEYAIRYASMAVVAAPEDVAKALGLPGGSDVILIGLAVLDGAEAVASADTYLPYVKGFPTIESVTHRADYPKFVDRKLWSILLRCELRIGASRLDSEHARRMACPESEPVIFARRLIRTDEGRAVGYSRYYLREGYGELLAESGYTASKPFGSEA